MRTKSIITAIGAAVLLTACDVKDPIYETEHPEKGEVTVTTDWTATNTATPPSEGYTLKAGDYSKEVMTAENTFNEYFIPGDYMLYAYNEPDYIDVNGTTATANYTGGTLGWFYYGILPITVKADSKHRFTVTMAQQVRELTLAIEPTGGTADRIATITATLSGVAGSYDMADGTHGTASSIALTFTKQTTGDYAGKWTATVRLLGVTGSVQKLTGAITFTGGTPTDIPLESDLSAGLTTFNAEKNKPLTLDGGRVELQTEAGFTATINDWTKITGGTGIAD